MLAADTPPAVANAARGDITVTLEGVDYVMRASFQAIGEMETATGKTLFELARAAEDGRLSLAELGEIVSACIRAHARSENDTDLAKVKAARISALIYAEVGGVLLIAKQAVTPMLFLAVTGGYDAQGFRRPMTTMATTPSAPTPDPA